jgi:excisionase family DNA binding protein
MEKATISVKEFAEMVGVNTIRAYEMVKQPGFPSLRCGRRLIILRNGLDKWLTDQTQKDKF